MNKLYIFLCLVLFPIQQNFCMSGKKNTQPSLQLLKAKIAASKLSDNDKLSAEVTAECNLAKQAENPIALDNKNNNPPKKTTALDNAIIACGFYYE